MKFIGRQGNIDLGYILGDGINRPVSRQKVVSSKVSEDVIRYGVYDVLDGLIIEPIYRLVKILDDENRRYFVEEENHVAKIIDDKKNEYFTLEDYANSLISISGKLCLISSSKNRDYGLLVSSDGKLVLTGDPYLQFDEERMIEKLGRSYFVGKNFLVDSETLNVINFDEDIFSVDTIGDSLLRINGISHGTITLPDGKVKCENVVFYSIDDINDELFKFRKFNDPKTYIADKKSGDTVITCDSIISNLYDKDGNIKYILVRDSNKQQVLYDSSYNKIDLDGNSLNCIVSNYLITNDNLKESIFDASGNRLLNEDYGEIYILPNDNIVALDRFLNIDDFENINSKVFDPSGKLISESKLSDIEFGEDLKMFKDKYDFCYKITDDIIVTCKDGCFGLADSKANSITKNEFSSYIYTYCIIRGNFDGIFIVDGNFYVISDNNVVHGPYSSVINIDDEFFKVSNLNSGCENIISKKTGRYIIKGDEYQLIKKEDYRCYTHYSKNSKNVDNCPFFIASRKFNYDIYTCDGVKLGEHYDSYENFDEGFILKCYKFDKVGGSEGLFDLINIRDGVTIGRNLKDAKWFTEGSLYRADEKLEKNFLQVSKGDGDEMIVDILGSVYLYLDDKERHLRVLNGIKDAIFEEEDMHSTITKVYTAISSDELPSGVGSNSIIAIRDGLIGFIKTSNDYKIQLFVYDSKKGKYISSWDNPIEMESYCRIYQKGKDGKKHYGLVSSIQGAYIPCEYDSEIVRWKDKFYAKSGGKNYILDEKGEIIASGTFDLKLPDLDVDNIYKDDYCIVENKNQNGLMDYNGNYSCPLVDRSDFYIKDYYNGKILVRDRKYNFDFILDVDGKVLAKVNLPFDNVYLYKFIDDHVFQINNSLYDFNSNKILYNPSVDIKERNLKYTKIVPNIYMCMLKEDDSMNVYITKYGDVFGYGDVLDSECLNYIDIYKKQSLYLKVYYTSKLMELKKSRAYYSEINDLIQDYNQKNSSLYDDFVSFLREQEMIRNGANKPINTTFFNEDN